MEIFIKWLDFKFADIFHSSYDTSKYLTTPSVCLVCGKCEVVILSFEFRVRWWQFSSKANAQLSRDTLCFQRVREMEREKSIYRWVQYYTPIYPISIRTRLSVFSRENEHSRPEFDSNYNKRFRVLRLRWDYLLRCVVWRCDTHPFALPRIYLIICSSSGGIEYWEMESESEYLLVWGGAIGRVTVLKFIYAFFISPCCAAQLCCRCTYSIISRMSLQTLSNLCRTYLLHIESFRGLWVFFIAVFLQLGVDLTSKTTEYFDFFFVI